MMSAGKGHVQIPLPKEKEGVIVLGLLHLDGRQSSPITKKLQPSHIETLLPDHDIPDIIWQFVEPQHLFGLSALNSHVYHGKWSEDSDTQVPLRRLTIGGQVAQRPTA